MKLVAECCAWPRSAACEMADVPRITREVWYRIVRVTGSEMPLSTDERMRFYHVHSLMAGSGLLALIQP